MAMSSTNNEMSDDVKMAMDTMLDYVHGSLSDRRRYLWTDAFAVFNLVQIYRISGQGMHLDLARALVDQVHSVLGHHRPDDSRRGWLSGADSDHPTRAGLRIGKKDPEDSSDDWDRDGQYFHYNTKWMQALSLMYITTHDDHYLTWAVEFALGIHDKFVHRLPNSRIQRIYWKMNIALTSPMTHTQGQHDALDGYLTYRMLQILSSSQQQIASLQPLVDDMRSIMSDSSNVTTDPLGAGCLCMDVYRALVMTVRSQGSDTALYNTTKDIMKDCLLSLLTVSNSGLFHLAFRDFGLSIGLQSMIRIKDLDLSMDNSMKNMHKEILEHSILIEKIHRHWKEPKRRSTNIWLEHKDINEVMWCTSLLDAYRFE